MQAHCYRPILLCWGVKKPESQVKGCGSVPCGLNGLGWGAALDALTMRLSAHAQVGKSFRKRIAAHRIRHAANCSLFSLRVHDASARITGISVSRQLSVFCHKAGFLPLFKAGFYAFPYPHSAMRYFCCLPEPSLISKPFSTISRRIRIAVAWDTFSSASTSLRTIWPCFSARRRRIS